MKTFILSLVLAAFAFTAMAQETVQVDVTKLSQQELALYQKLKQHAQDGLSLDNLSPEKIDKYAQIGKSFGTAFKECWTTVSTDAERFANSSAGKWAMVMVTWKIMGKDATQLLRDIIRIGIGVFLLAIGVPFFIYIFRRNCVPARRLKSANKIGWFTYRREYDGTTDPIHEDVAITYGICFVVFVLMCCIIMFA